MVAMAQEATMSSEAAEAEARRVFVQYDSNADRRIDQAELGELLHALMCARHGVDNVTMSPSALTFAASLWLQVRLWRLLA